MSIDVHAHVIPTEIVGRARGEGVFGVRESGGELVHPEGFRSPLTEDFYKAGAIIDRMDGSDVERTLLSLSPTMFFYDQDPAEAVAFARVANEGIAGLVAGHERFDGLAQLPMQDPAAAAAELRRAVEELGMVGGQIGTNVGELPLDDSRLEVVFATAAELRVPLMLHPYFVGPKPRLGEYYLTNTIGNPLDTAIAGARVIHSGMLDRLPGLDLILVHGGGYLPFQLGRLDHAYEVREEPAVKIARPPSAYVDGLWFDTLTHSDKALRFLAEMVGEDRLLLGTDLPYDMADSHPLERIRRLEIDPARLTANAERLLSRRAAADASPA